MTDMPRVNPALAAFAQLGQGACDSMTDSMVDRISTTMVNALEIVDKVNQPDIKEGLLTLLDAIGNMHRTGVMQTAIDAVYLIHGARSAANDSIVERLFIFMEHMLNNFATEDLATLAHEAKGAMEDALDSCGGIPQGGGGLLGTIRMMSKPETQEALRFMLAFSCSLRKRSVVISKSAHAS